MIAFLGDIFVCLFVNKANAEFKYIQKFSIIIHIHSKILIFNSHYSNKKFLIPSPLFNIYFIIQIFQIKLIIIKLLKK